MNKQLSKALSQAWKFGVGGGVGVLSGYATLYILTEFFGVWYPVSAVFALTLNYVLNFILHKFWAFENDDLKRIRRQAIKFVVMCISFLCANSLLLYVLVEYAHLRYLIAQIILTAIISFISYFITRKIFAH